MDPAVSGSATATTETGAFRAAGSGPGTGGGAGATSAACVVVTSEPPSTHESCIPHFRDDCKGHLLFGCLSAAASALSNAFVLVQVSRFQQVIGVFTLQVPSEAAKVNLRTPQ